MAENSASSSVVDGEPTDSGRNHGAAAPEQLRRSSLSPTFVVGAVIVVCVAALAGYLGHGAFQSRHADHQRDVFLEVGQQVAIDITTIGYDDADTDVKRILDLSTGSFRDGFRSRSPGFVDLLKRDQSRSEGAIIEIGLQSETGDSATVVAIVSVKTMTAAVPEPHQHEYRLRIDERKTGEGTQVSDVEFI